MTRTWIAGLALFAAFGSAAQAPAKDAARGAASPAPAGDVARGKGAYMKNYCHTCHGTAGQGGDRGSGPRIAYDVWPYEAFAQQTRRPRAVMPRYPAEYLGDQDMADIYAYVASFRKGPKASEIPLLKE